MLSITPNLQFWSACTSLVATEGPKYSWSQKDHSIGSLSGCFPICFYSNQKRTNQRNIRDSNPWPSPWQGDIVTNSTNIPFAFTFQKLSRFYCRFSFLIVFLFVYTVACYPSFQNEANVLTIVVQGVIESPTHEFSWPSLVLIALPTELPHHLPYMRLM